MRISILLYSNTGFISRLIRWQTRSRYSHASICTGDQVYEAREGVGVLTRRFDRKKLDKNVTEFKMDLNKVQETNLLVFLHKQLGKKYDYTMVARFVSRRQETRSTSKKWFCSELVFAAFKHVSVDLLRDTDPWEVSPGLLARSTLLGYPRKMIRDG